MINNLFFILLGFCIIFCNSKLIFCHCECSGAKCGNPSFFISFIFVISFLCGLLRASQWQVFLLSSLYSFLSSSLYYFVILSLSKDPGIIILFKSLLRLGFNLQEWTRKQFNLQEWTRKQFFRFISLKYLYRFWNKFRMTVF